MAYDRNYRPKMVLACRRTGARHRLRHAHDAHVEIVLPDGSPRRFDLLELSSGGVCFGLDDGQIDLGPGSRFEQVVLHVAATRIAGTLTIAHATEEFAAGTICGAQFQPAGEADSRALATLIASLGG
jgi:c-di-GMP-binding flagellar brake protein YcgR